jgi:mono/diheme cytochrome c family protein
MSEQQSSGPWYVFRVLVALVAACAALPASRVAGADAKELFEKQVRPLFERKCFDCHSSKADEVKGGLKLDTLEDVMKGGESGPAIIPGDVENSFLLRAIRYQEADYQMPPSGRLSDDLVAKVEAWVKALDPESK